MAFQYPTAARVIPSAASETPSDAAQKGTARHEPSRKEKENERPFPKAFNSPMHSIICVICTPSTNCLQHFHEVTSRSPLGAQVPRLVMNINQPINVTSGCLGFLLESDGNTVSFRASAQPDVHGWGNLLEGKQSMVGRCRSPALSRTFVQRACRSGYV